MKQGFVPMVGTIFNVARRQLLCEVIRHTVKYTTLNTLNLKTWRDRLNMRQVTVSNVALTSIILSTDIARCVELKGVSNDSISIHKK